MRVGLFPFLVSLGFVLTVAVPASSADSAEYRPVDVPPTPPTPPSPGLPPVPPCAVNGFVIDCTAGGNWASLQIQNMVTYVSDASLWLDGRVDDAGMLLAGDFVFSGTGSSTTVHVHDDVSASLVHDNILFVVEGGPAGAQWTCRHICSNLPDTSLSVSISPLKVPPEDWASPTIAYPPVSGTITVTFNP